MIQDDMKIYEKIRDDIKIKESIYKKKREHITDTIKTWKDSSARLRLF